MLDVKSFMSVNWSFGAGVEYLQGTKPDGCGRKGWTNVEYSATNFHPFVYNLKLQIGRSNGKGVQVESGMLKKTMKLCNR